LRGAGDGVGGDPQLRLGHTVGLGRVGLLRCHATTGAQLAPSPFSVAPVTGTSGSSTFPSSLSPPPSDQPFSTAGELAKDQFFTAAGRFFSVRPSGSVGRGASALAKWARIAWHAWIIVDIIAASRARSIRGHGRWGSIHPSYHVNKVHDSASPAIAVPVAIWAPGDCDKRQ
jgi:hypothetical protein